MPLVCAVGPQTALDAPERRGVGEEVLLALRWREPTCRVRLGGIDEGLWRGPHPPKFYPNDLVKSRSDKNGSVIWDKDRWWGTKTKAIKRRSQVFTAEGEILRKIRDKNVPAYVATLRRNQTVYLVS